MSEKLELAATSLELQELHDSEVALAKAEATLDVQTLALEQREERQAQFSSLVGIGTGIAAGIASLAFGGGIIAVAAALTTALAGAFTSTSALRSSRLRSRRLAEIDVLRAEIQLHRAKLRESEARFTELQASIDEIGQVVPVIPFERERLREVGSRSVSPSDSEGPEPQVPQVFPSDNGGQDP